MKPEASDNARPSFSLDFAFAQGNPPRAQATLRQQPEDFVVSEHLGMELSGDGEHLYLQVEKKNLNTLELVAKIARLAGVRNMDVGYAGLKDKRAITRQWFSVYLPVDKPIEWQSLNGENARLVSQTRHRQKLRRGQHQSNHFHIRLKQFSGDLAQLEARLKIIASKGVPNYFGPQRFGINANNLVSADRLLTGEYPERDRKKRGLYLSAARSYLFNKVLSARVGDSSWRDLETGDIACDGYSQSAVPSGPLWGRGRLSTWGRILDLETRVTGQHQDWCNRLEHVGLKQERRPLVLTLNNFEWEIIQENNDCILEIQFSLLPGSYATSVIREICSTRAYH